MQFKLKGAWVAPLLALVSGTATLSAHAQEVPVPETAVPDTTTPEEQADTSIEKAEKAVEETPDAPDVAETPEGGTKVEFEPVPYREDRALLPDTTTIIPRVAGEQIVDNSSTSAQFNSLADQRLRAGSAQPVLALGDSLEMVLQNNPQRAAARAQLEAALANVGIAKSAGGLQINLNGGLTAQRGFLQPNRNTSTGGTGGGGTGGGGTGGGGTGGGGTGGGGTGGGGTGGGGTGGGGTGGGGTGGGGTGGGGTGGGGTGGGGTGGGGTGGGGTDGGTGGGIGTGTNTAALLGQGNFTQTLSVGATLPIYTGGRVKASKRAAQAGARAQAALTLQTEQDLVNNTTAAYLAILRTEQLLTVAESNLAVSQERRRVAEVRFVGGAAARSDVLRADSVLAAARQRRVQAASDVATAKSNLNVLMGRLPETPFSAIPIVGFTPLVTIAAATGTDSFPNLGADSSAELRAIAELNRPSLAAQREQINVSQANVDVARAARKPSIAATLSGALRNPANFLGAFTASLGGSIAQMLFDSGNSGYQIRQAREVVALAQQNLESQNLQVAGTIEQNLLAIDTSQQKLNDTAAGVIAAAGALRAAQTGYRAGTLTQVDVSDAQTALLQAQTDAVNANFDLASARVSLASSIGVLAPEAQTAYDAVLDEELERAARIADSAPAKKPAAAKRRRQR